jgi:probable phosphoglycerate mutase
MKHPPAGIYASPLEPARETAAPIARALSRRVVVDRGLNECDFGEWTGRSLTALSRTKEWESVQNRPNGFRFPGGESFEEMRARVWGTLLRLSARHQGEAFVAVSHADCIKAAVAEAAGIPLDLFQRLVVSPCSISVIAFGANRIHVVCMNRTTSIDDLALS